MLSKPKNLSSNIVGQTIVTICNLIFLPIYVSELGIDGYAFFGLYTVFLSWLILLDGGLTPTIIRQLAKHSSSKEIPNDIRSIFKTIEFIFLILCLVIFIIFLIFGANIADIWLNTSDNLKDREGLLLFSVAVLSCFGLLESLYRGALLGLQNHLIMNVIISFGAIFKSLGSVILITTFDYDIEYFLYWHISISLIYVSIMKYFVYKRFSFSKTRSIISIAKLRPIASFASAMFVILFLGTVLTQLDKIILGKMLNLSDLGFYIFAYTCIGIITKLASPISTTYYPQLCELYNSNDLEKMRKNFFEASQLTVLFTIGICFTLLVASYNLIWAWSGSHELAIEVSKIISILSFGSFINVICWMPYYLQLSFGITKIAIRSNLIAVIIIIPLLIILIKNFGTLGAAACWPLTNLIFLYFSANLSIKKIFPRYRVKWFLEIIIYPIFSMFLLGFLIDTFDFYPETIFNSIIFCIICFMSSSILALTYLKRTWKFIPILRNQK